MFERVCGFFHKMHTMDSQGLSEPPKVYIRTSETILVEMDKKTYNLLFDIFSELNRADRKYKDDPMQEADVAIKTIECEFVELEREVARSVPRPDSMYKEAVQVAAMGFKFMRDICKGGSSFE